MKNTIKGYNQKIVIFIVFWSMVFIASALLVLATLQYINRDVAKGIDDEVKHYNEIAMYHLMKDDTKC